MPSNELHFTVMREAIYEIQRGIEEQRKIIQCYGCKVDEFYQQIRAYIHQREKEHHVKQGRKERESGSSNL